MILRLLDTLPCIIFLLIFLIKNLGTYKKIFTGSCSSNGMQVITSIQECNVAAQEIGNTDTAATITENSPRPEGCYDNGNLWFAINPMNKGNGADSTRHPICKSTDVEQIGKPLLTCIYC